MTQPGIVPLYYGPIIHPNEGILIAMPPSQFAKAEIASLSRKEIGKLVRRLDQEFREGRNDPAFLRQMWEQDFEGAKKPNSLTLIDLEHAVKGELHPTITKDAQDEPADEPSHTSYNLIRLQAFHSGILDFMGGRRGVSSSISVHDLLSASIKSEESGAGKEAKKYWDTTIRAPFIELHNGAIYVNPAFYVSCQCRAHTKHIAKDSRIPPRAMLVSCTHIAASLRELYLERRGKLEPHIRGMEGGNIRGYRGESIYLYRFHDVPELALEMIARRYAFGQRMSDIDRSYMDLGDIIFSDQFARLRESGQVAVEAVKSTQSFPNEYGRVKEEMIAALDEKGYIFLGYGRDFKCTPYETFSISFMHPSSGKIAHILFGPQFERPLYLFKMKPGQLDGKYGAPLDRLPGHPKEHINIPFVDTDDMFNRERVCLVASPKSILSLEQKNLYP